MSEQAEEFHTPDRQPFWDANLQPQPVDVVGELLRSNQDGRTFFKEAADAAKTTDHEQMLRAISEQHGRYEASLVEYVVQLGGEPQGNNSLSDILQQAWVKVEGALGSNDTHLMESCLDKLKDIEKTYEEAQKVKLPRNVSEEIREQHEAIAYERKQLAQVVA